MPIAPESRPTLTALTVRFLQLGGSAFGGPVAQIARLHDEFVVRGQLIDADRFRRALALYQALPGPEATEMCIWIGTTLRGRLGGLLAGLGFVLPGLSLMLLSCWLLFHAEPWPAWLAAVFAGLQCGAVALVLRATWRLSRVTLGTRVVPWLIALVAAASSLAAVGFGVALLGGGCVLLAANAPRRIGIAFAPMGVRRNGPLLVVSALAWFAAMGLDLWLRADASVAAATSGAANLGLVGLRAGALTFGGAYTAIPFLQADAVGPHGWMTNEQFASGLAIGSVLPAPMVVVGAWVGWAGDGLRGALWLTGGIFLPAFALPLLLHERLERMLAHRPLQAFLDGTAAAVVGLIAATAWRLLAPRTSVVELGIVAVALGLACLRVRAAALLTMAASVLLGLLVH